MTEVGTEISDHFNRIANGTLAQMGVDFGETVTV
jgi:hypothetical protein